MATSMRANRHIATRTDRRQLVGTKLGGVAGDISGPGPKSMANKHKLPDHRPSTSLILIVVVALLIGLCALGLLTYAPGSPLTLILAATSGTVLVGFVIGIVVMGLRGHRPRRSD